LQFYNESNSIGSNLDKLISPPSLDLTKNWFGIGDVKIRGKSFWWWRNPESNWGHKDFQSSALPTELFRQITKSYLK
jgi:hypothetical protein